MHPSFPHEAKYCETVRAGIRPAQALSLSWGSYENAAGRLANDSMIQCTYFTKGGLHNSPLQGCMVVSLNYLAKMPESEVTLSKVGHGVGLPGK